MDVELILFFSLFSRACAWVFGGTGSILEMQNNQIHMLNRYIFAISYVSTNMHIRNSSFE